MTRVSRGLARQHRKAILYNALGHPTKPKLIGNNIGVWRSDYERVNGYDERFVGWGCEDDDLRLRLRRAGVGVRSILDRTFTCHRWHPPAASTPGTWSAGANVAYLNRRSRTTRCRYGLVGIEPRDRTVSVIGKRRAPGVVPADLTRPGAGIAAEVEVRFHPGAGRFSGHADLEILAVTGRAAVPRRLARRIDAILTDRPLAGVGDTPVFPLDGLVAAIDTLS